MPKAFLLKRNFSGADTLEWTTPLSSQHANRAIGKGESKRIHQTVYRKNRGNILGLLSEERSTQKGKRFSYPADVCVGVSLNNTATSLSLETDFINNKKNSSGERKPAENHSNDARPKSEAGTKRRQTYTDDSDSSVHFSSGEEDELSTSTNCIGISKTSKHKANQIRKERPNKAVHRCDQCGKIFKTKYTLSIHLKMPDHTESRPFVCNICGKGFRLSSTLCRHKIIHTQKKPHKCETCNKSFNRSSTLKTHVRTHSDNKAFICDICGKGFHQKGNLRNHIMIHTGEKPFKCSKCQRAFNKMSNLKFHMHTHTDNLPYQCKVCRQRFAKKYELKQHNDDLHA